MKLLLDMNLSPRLAVYLGARGWDAVHWSDVGDPRATDRTIFDWAAAEQRTILTHDLDFGAMLAAGQATGPSVIQIRCQDVLPPALGPRLVGLLTRFEAQLESGALIVVDEGRDRVRVLPLRR
ncbi:MAG: DUF5615 family PIN-like protein [Chloroflexi bacterium]|nr:DUF5615 family PIN-like protein [Chloroflexota bacterium]